jgi:hypothetical protein
LDQGNGETEPEKLTTPWLEKCWKSKHQQSSSPQIIDNTTAWGRVIWRDWQTVFEWSTGRHVRSSSYRSECEAMEDAITWLSGNASDRDRVVILTDSLSLVNKLQSGRVKKVWLPVMYGFQYSPHTHRSSTYHVMRGFDSTNELTS